MNVFKRIFGDMFRKTPEAQLVFDDTLISFTWNGENEQLLWNDVVEVKIITTDLGPTLDDVFWVMVGNTGRFIVIPDEVDGAEELLDRLGKMPGFNHDKVTDAMASTDNAVFLCWRLPRLSAVADDIDALIWKTVWSRSDPLKKK
jgi:hypothetical protein